MSMRRPPQSSASVWRLLLGATLSIALIAPSGPTSTSYNAAAWLDDLAHLRSAMDAHYANLEWVARVRHTDLKAITDAAAHAIATAADDTAARTAIEDFLNAMGDGHLEIDWPESDQQSTPAGLCARLGFRARKLSAGLAFQNLRSFENVASPAQRYFPVGTLRLPDGSRVGTIRIGVFSSKWYPELCDAAIARLHLSQDAPCVDDCSDIVERTAEDLLTEKLTASIQALERIPNLRAIAVDLTRNGGGTDWVEPAMREFSGVHLEAPVMGFVKHPHWQEEFARRIAAVDTALPRATGAYRATLLKAKLVYMQLAVAAKQHCDQSPLWRGEVPNCSIVGSGAMYVTGALPYAPPGVYAAGDPVTPYLFLPDVYRYREGVYRGPLYVIVDENTASAAERFPAVLQDNRAARVVGAPTYGAGCGFTNGGIPTTLPHSGASVMMPDCVQYRKDGTNAVAGVTPDILVPWHATDNAYLRALRAYETLSTGRHFGAGRAIRTKLSDLYTRKRDATRPSTARARLPYAGPSTARARTRCARASALDDTDCLTPVLRLRRPRVCAAYFLSG